MAASLTGAALLRLPAAWRYPTVRAAGAAQLATGAVALRALLFAEVGRGRWALALFGYFLYGCVGLSAGFHRYLAHRSFAAR